ncbi:MAG: DUF1015 family protein [Ignavibacteria bacterium]|jgi:uncharacterized protein (DUF1015 family)|nr:DUF1015 family protein [Ignavibacteria bacterium]MDH7527203.1 DUF1015 family protein [Ignavibacteria bacterium]
MAIIKPFKALRPERNVAHLVASVPYDVVSREEAFELAEGNPISFLRVTRSEIELPPNVNPYSQEVYQLARKNLQLITEKAPLIQDQTDRFYLYQLIMGEQSQTGIAATFSVDDYDNNVILKHERTRKEKEDDRTNHILTTSAQTGPVFLTYRDVSSINELVDKIKMEVAPIYDFIAKDGVQHKVWIVPEEYNQVIIEEIKKVEKIYIADGHHRAASASRVRAIKREQNPEHRGDEEYNFFLAVLFPASQLKILPYNRIVFSLNNLSDEEFLEKVKINFNLSEIDYSEPKQKRNICMYFSNKWYLLTPNEYVKEGNSYGENLDVSILQNYLLKPFLGIDDPRTSKNIDFVGGIRGTKELERLVNSGKAKVAFSMYPVSIEDLMNISDAGEIMPPKSTWFEPKLRDGLLIHLI